MTAVTVEVVNAGVQVLEVANPAVQVVEIPVVVGAPGPAGPPGTGLVVAQDTALATWTIPHNLGRIPAVTIYVAGFQVDTDIYATTSQVVVTFATPAAGVAVLS